MTKSATPGKNAFIAVFITVLIDILGFAMVIPVVPDMLQEVTNLAESQAIRWSGYLLFIFAIMQFISSPILGAISDRYGRRPVILASLLGYAIDFLIIGFAKSIVVLFIGRLFSGTFAATYATANAYIADITPSAKRAARFGMLGAAFGIGFVIGPGIGGLIGKYFGPRAPFFAASALAFMNFVYCYFVLPETLSKDKRRAFDWRRANPLGNLIQLKQYPVMMPVLSAMFLFQLAHFALQSTWSWYGKVKFNWQADEIGYSLMMVGLSAAIVQGVLIRLILPRIGERRAVIYGGAITMFAYLAYAFASSGWMIYPIIAFGSLGAIMQPAIQGIMSRTISEDAQGELQGAIASMMSIAMIIGPIFMTQIFSTFTSENAPIYFPGASFLSAAILVLLAAIPMLIAFQRITQPKDTVTGNTSNEQTDS